MQTVGRVYLRDRTNGTPSLTDLPIYERRPRGPASRPCYMESCPDTALLYVYVYVYLYVYLYIYVYIYIYVYGPARLRRRQDHRKHCTAA